MTLDELKALPAFVTLGTQNQKDFVVAFCSNGADKIDAAEKAYAVNDDKSARATADRNLRHPAIKALVDEFYGKAEGLGSREALRALAWKKAQTDGDPEMQFKWATLYMKVSGFEAEKTPADPPKGEEDWVERLNKIKG